MVGPAHGRYAGGRGLGGRYFGWPMGGLDGLYDSWNRDQKVQSQEQIRKSAK